MKNATQLDGNEDWLLGSDSAKSEWMIETIRKYVLSHREDILDDINDFGELKPILEELENK